MVSSIIAGLIGLLVGSCLGALAARWPGLDRSFLLGRSRCAACGTALSPAELIPLWSWIRQRGRCRHCGAPIGWLPLLAELGGGGAALLAFASLPPATALLFTLTGWCLLLLALIDAAHGRLPDILTLPLALAGLLACAAGAAPGLPAPLESALAASLGFALFHGIDRLYRRWRGRAGLGLGDAKLLAALGAWLGLEALAHGVLLAALMALAFAYAKGLRQRFDALAFGPWLALAFAALLWLRLACA